MKKIISKSFTFEAAHKLKDSKGIKNNNIHGHSFHVKIYLKDEINKNGMILDFHILEKEIINLKKTLDHSYLNNIKELNSPTLENIGTWLWKKLNSKFINLYKIKIERKTCGESFSISNDL